MSSRTKTWLTPAGVQELRTAALSSEIPTYLQDHREALLELLYDTGIRRSEAAALNVGDLQLEGATATVSLAPKIQKRLPSGDLRREATLALSDRTRNALQRYVNRSPLEPPGEDGALFPSRSSGRITGKSVNRAIKRLAVVADVEPETTARAEAGPEDVTAHTLRHSVAYRIIVEEGGRLEDVQMRLRHRSRQVTDQEYSHLIPR